MSHGRVGVTDAATPTKWIDNTEISVGGYLVERQRTDEVPSRNSTYYAGISGSVQIPTTLEIVSIIAHWTNAGSLAIGGGASIPTFAGTQWSDTFFDAPIVGIGAGSVVFTGSDSYYVRVRPVIA